MWIVWIYDYQRKNDVGLLFDFLKNLGSKSSKTIIVGTKKIQFFLLIKIAYLVQIVKKLQPSNPFLNWLFLGQKLIKCICWFFSIKNLPCDMFRLFSKCFIIKCVISVKIHLECINTTKSHMVSYVLFQTQEKQRTKNPFVCESNLNRNSTKHMSNFCY